MKNVIALLGLLALASSAFADAPQMYKWTDAAGVIHYSDKPPVLPAADLQTLDMPSFPAQDTEKLAEQQALLIAQTQTAQQLQQAEAAQEAQATALAQQQAQLQAALAALQQPQSEPESEPLIYSTSAYVPRAYRANLYLPYHPSGRRADMPSATKSRPAVSLLQRP